MSANGENYFGFRISDFGFQNNRQRRVTTSTAQHHLALSHDANDGIVHVPDDGPIVDEEEIGDAAEARHRFAFVDADRFVAQVSARGDDRKPEFAHE